MRIKSIEYENFRNFKDRGKITCATDGKVTIIYGKNGDGKTTLHQLFQWIFYGKVNFNKTTTDRLYNLKYESEMETGTQFEVMGRIEFEHMGERYLLRRSQFYEKTLFDGSRPVNTEFKLQKLDSDNNWKIMDKPEEVIEKLLPSGLSEYFFFDGESMIADLRVKGSESAKKLKTALYSMFELDILDMAIDHLGDTNLKKTAIGKLYINKGDDIPGSDLSIAKNNVERVQTILDKLNTNLNKYQEERTEKENLIREFSEQIGSTKTRAEYEEQRKNSQKNRERFQKNIDNIQATFGEIVAEKYSMFLISKAIYDAKNKLKLKVDDTKLPLGLDKPLIEYLLLESTETCICGNPLNESEKEHIRMYLELLPPASYASLYQNYSERARMLASGYDRSTLDKYIGQVIENVEGVEFCDEEIRSIDNEQKKSADVENLVIARQKAEGRISELNGKITETEVEIRKAIATQKKVKKEFDQLSENTEKANNIQRRIEILEQVRKDFEIRLNTASITYSKRLQENIQELLDVMLTSVRNVKVTSKFEVSVVDSFNDESKSEGQFAIVSFAYIGGILKMLQSEAHLVNKEYPLVLDGPFSKLDSDQRQNVVDVIPKFAPQIILFSKDSLQDIFAPEQVGRVYTITSNSEKNVASIKEGYHWK